MTGFDPLTEKHKLDFYCPVRNVTSEYPPILMIHGTDDKDVPHAKSADMAIELSRHDVSFEFITVPQGRHGLHGADEKVIRRAKERALEFIKEHLK